MALGSMIRRMAERLVQMRELSKERYVSPYYVARVYAGLGDSKKVLQLLRNALDDHSDRMLVVPTDPVFDPFRNEPEFLALTNRGGFARYRSKPPLATLKALR